jgi:DNA-binding IclR family transcriptional regulator
MTAMSSQRIENLRLLSVRMEGGAMSLREIAEILRFSPSGARKFLRFLREQGFVSVASERGRDGLPVGTALYRMTLSSAAITDMFGAPPGQLAGLADSAQGMTSSMMLDGCHERPRQRRAPEIKRDPLVAALFGPAAVALR